ncbi:MAG: hypothetical protein IIA72_06585 [Proteobacteria bacterium]|nr:hypothetical protein [Pseudomonadota bacterium]
MKASAGFTPRRIVAAIVVHGQAGAPARPLPSRGAGSVRAGERLRFHCRSSALPPAKARDLLAADPALGEGTEVAVAVEHGEHVADGIGVVDVVGNEDHPQPRRLGPEIAASSRRTAQETLRGPKGSSRRPAG